MMRSRKLKYHKHNKTYRRNRRWGKFIILTIWLLIIGLVGDLIWKETGHALLLDIQTKSSMANPSSLTTLQPSQSVAALSPNVTQTAEATSAPISKPTIFAKLLKLQQETALEASYYSGNQVAKDAMDKKWTLIPNTVGPGDVLLVRHNKPGTVTWQGKTYKLLPFGTGYYSYIAVSILTKPGTYKIGNQTLTVVKRTYKTDRITVSKQLESIRENTQRIMADQKRIDKARSHSASEFLFKPDSAFIQPVKGRISTPFGYMRYVNGKYDGSHRAIDIAAPKGTPVKATNDGIVALADKLYLTGNSVYIDHGMNLFSQYIHMSKLLVKTGDHVKKGQTIGLVGSTGFSTGPHLHFTFWANNIPVNPNLFFGTTPFHWYKEKGSGK